MAKAKSRARPSRTVERAFAALIDPITGRTALVESGSKMFQDVAYAMMVPRSMEASWGTSVKNSYAEPGKRSMATQPEPLSFGTGRTRTTAYQWLTGTILPSLRQRLLPDIGDLGAIVERAEFYRKHYPWVNRALILRAGLNAAEFRIDSPGNPEQEEWMRGLKRRLRMFSFMREFFWQMRAFSQVVVLWRTKPGGRDPISIECANLEVYQPRYNPLDGSRPRIVVLPGRDANLKRLAQDVRSADQTKQARAREQLALYPKPLVEAVTSTVSSSAEVDADLLEDSGFHFDYAAFDKRHYEDWAFPGIYSIFPYLEMLMLADDADINALHHYKAGILLVTLGPTEPRAGDETVMPGEGELKSIESKLTAMAKSRLPAWAARGDLRITWVVPPEHIMNPDKVKSAKEKVLDWLGISRLAYPGQDFAGAFAVGQIGLKFLQQESKDERQIAKEFAEEWFHQRSEGTNKFKGAIYPTARFDPNALTEPRLILEAARLFMQLGGADEGTIAEILDYDAEVWLARKSALAKLKKKYKTDFAPEFTPAKPGSPSARPEGRPTTADQPTPERGNEPQPRPSTSEAAEVVEREFGLRAEDVKAALDAEFVGGE